MNTIQNNKIVHTFIDEFGTPVLNTDKSGNEEFCIYTTVLIKEKDSDHATLIYNKVIEDDFKQQKHIKSAHIPNNKSGHART